MATSAQVRDEILAGKWDETLGVLYGGGAAELRRQRARYAAALEQFELYFGPGRQVRLYSAPGRTELGGNHTDHQHGYGLAAAVRQSCGGSGHAMRRHWNSLSSTLGRGGRCGCTRPRAGPSWAATTPTTSTVMGWRRR